MNNSDAGGTRRARPDRSPFSEFLGLQRIALSRDAAIAELPVTEPLSNRNGVMHGGTVMALADDIGGTLTFENLPGGMSTTTIESKTNFLRPIRVGDIARASSILLHRGRKTMIVQTTITRGDGKVAAIVTQTQMVMAWEAPPTQGCG